MAKRESKILIVLLSLILFSCRKEFSSTSTYIFSYSYQRNCSGIIWITVPNTFAPEQKFDGWFPSIVKLTADSNCLLSLPDSIQQKKYLALKVEVRDVDNELWYQYNSMHDTSIVHWNGRRKGFWAPPGTYFWHFTLHDLDGSTHQESGILHLLF